VENNHRAEEEIPREEGWVEEHSFDGLAKEVADGTLTRSKALKYVGAALLGTLGLGSLPGVAEGGKKKGGKKKGKKKKPTCPAPCCGGNLTNHLNQFCPGKPPGTDANGCCATNFFCCPFACCPDLPTVACGQFEETPCVTVTPV
jgi:hypothetical protein